MNNSPIGDQALIDNQGSLNCSATVNVDRRVSLSNDGGVTFRQGIFGSGGSTLMGNDPVWPNCIVPAAWPTGGPTGLGGNNRGRFAALHDDVHSLWHIYWTKETFNGQNGSASGQRVFHTIFDDTFTDMTSEELAPYHNADCSSYECFSDQFMPSASWSPAAPGYTTHAVIWHDTQRDPYTPRGTIWGAFSHNNGYLGSFSNVEVAHAGALAPWAFTGTNGNTPWGDYEGIASDRAGMFFFAWGDNRLGGSVTQLFSQALHP